MAKTKTAKVAKDAVEATEKETLKAAAVLRKGALAYVGLYGAAFDRAKMRVAQVRTATDGLFDNLVVKGEEIESKATVIAKGAQAKATATYATTSAKVRDILPVSANDRVQELEAEIASLNKKITTLAKNAAPRKAAKKVTTEKTVKTTVETPKTDAVKTEESKAA